MPTASDASMSPLSREFREYERTTVSLPAKLFLPAEDATIDCEVVNLSGGGAGIRCEEPPPLQAFVVLYVEGIGRLEGVTTRFVDGELGLRLICRETKRKRLLADIANFVENGLTFPTKLRRHTRERSVSEGYFQRANRELVACAVVDISLQGLSLKTTERPPIGEIINLGKTCGRVVRHHDEGIAIHFLNAVEKGPCGV